MSTVPRRPRIPLFFAIGIGLSLLMAVFKAVVAALAEAYLYSVPWLGGFLRSIELVEISNILVFACLSAGIGAATLLLPRHWNPWAKAALLIVVSPFVFSASYWMQQHLWIQRVAKQANISYPEAHQITDRFLQRGTGSGGFWGFYAYSTEVSELPTHRDSLESEEVSSPGQALVKELKSYNDPRANLAAAVFSRVGWFIRLMYISIAGLTGLIYYVQGRDWAEAKRPDDDDDLPKNLPTKSPLKNSPKNSPVRPRPPT